MSIWSRASSNAVNLLTATALTSLSFHLLFARRDAAELRARYTARISILESLILRLTRGERIEPSEIERLANLSRKLKDRHETDDLGDPERGSNEKISWTDVILGTARNKGVAFISEDRIIQELDNALAVDTARKPQT